MVKKIVLAIVLFIACCTSVFAADSSPSWEWISSESVHTLYLDVNNVEYDRDERVAHVVFKATFMKNKDGRYTLLYYTFDFNRKAMEQTQYTRVDAEGNEGEAQKPIVSDYVYIAPDSWSEKAANKVADLYGIPHLYKRTSNGWKLVKSTPQQSIYIDKDSLDYNPDQNYCYVWAKFQGLPGHEYTTRYYCDFTHNTVSIRNFEGQKNPRSAYGNTDSAIIFYNAKRLCW